MVIAGCAADGVRRPSRTTMKQTMSDSMLMLLLTMTATTIAPKTTPDDGHHNDRGDDGNDNDDDITPSKGVGRPRAAPRSPREPTTTVKDGVVVDDADETSSTTIPRDHQRDISGPPGTPRRGSSFSSSSSSSSSTGVFMTPPHAREARPRPRSWLLAEAQSARLCVHGQKVDRCSCSRVSSRDLRAEEEAGRKARRLTYEAGVMAGVNAVVDALHIDDEDDDDTEDLGDTEDLEEVD